MDVLFINFRSFRGLTCFAPRFAFRTGVLGYTKRPSSFVKPFPDPALFHPRNGRRLEAEEDLPERVHFEVEDGGYEFHYDFAGTPTVERVFNLDSEENGVEAIQCADGRLSIYWNTSKAKDAAKLEKDAVISGSPEWQCNISNSTKSRSGMPQRTGLLLRVLQVADAAPVSSVFRVAPVSPLQLFRNVYLGVSWRRLEQPGWSAAAGGEARDGRQLQTSCGDFEWGLNYDCDSQQASQSYSLGPLKCSNCYVTLNATPTFQLQTNDEGQPTRLSFGLSAKFQSHLEVRLDDVETSLDPNATEDTWTTIFTGPRSENLIDTFTAITMPMFGKLISSVNDWTVNIGIYVIYTLKGKAGLQSSLDGVLRDQRTLEWTGAEVAWTKECLGLEANVAYSTQRATTSVAATAIAASSQVDDEDLCVDIYAFETDGNLDTFSDEPYAGWCFLGTCHNRPTSSFSGNRAEWDAGYQCVKIQSSLLQSNKVYLGAWESDTLWDDVYIERASEDLFKLENLGNRTINATPTATSKGTYARLFVRFKRTPSSRLLSQSSGSSSCGQSFYAGGGMHGGISGFVFPDIVEHVNLMRFFCLAVLLLSPQLPSLFEHGGTRLVDPIQLPSYRSEMSQQLCAALPGSNTGDLDEWSLEERRGKRGLCVCFWTWHGRWKGGILRNSGEFVGFRRVYCSVFGE
ncbi:unnamed protein product [Durusdinium trenchii]|uniref:Uncharacterized protein n=1 Tax=Durusdinium trenchii TaxID=1381693 RepID=A0ABP0KDR6_9DINO